MNTNESKLKNLLKTIVNTVADSGDDDWPPKCSALLYQPVHPSASEDKNQQGRDSSKGY